MLAAATFLLAMSQALPTKPQIDWQNMEVNAFIHFGPNTFTNVEWGGGKEDPNLFAPTDLDCDQWMRALKSAGMKGVILTAKHHDGFCLWPSRFSTHTVAQTRWRDGKGDVVKEVADACRRHGLKFGVYLSPWDRNHPTYGTPEYNDTFVHMLEEVLTKYGPVFEVWFDGANGEGPNGKRQVYDWPRFHATVRRLQPKAVMFSDAGPDVRWVGNESGLASETSWSMIPSGRYVPGTPLYAELGEGSPTGDSWVPPECDVSIRPGWFFHAEEDAKVKSANELLDLYEKSVGRNSLLLLNVPPDRRGHLADPDVKSLAEFGALRKRVYGRNLAAKAVRAGSGADFEIRLPKAVRINRVMLGEAISRGQRVKAFHVDAEIPGVGWRRIVAGTTIGRKRILPVEPVEATALRVTVTESLAPAEVTEFGLYLRG